MLVILKLSCVLLYVILFIICPIFNFKGDILMASLNEVSVLSKEGRVTIPSQIRKSLNLNPGDEILVTQSDNVIQIMSVAVAIKNVQNMVRPFKTENQSMVDNLISERREAAKNE
jgi:AbrB family looped-hinge helix DNA binding protein